jgi:hypothetical protein
MAVARTTATEGFYRPALWILKKTEGELRIRGLKPNGKKAD